MNRILKILALAVITVSSLNLAVEAGWWRNNGKTSWTERPTPATAWARDVNQDLVLLGSRMEIYNTTIRHYTLGEEGSNSVANTGFWLMDSNGDFSVHPDLSSDDVTTNEGREWNYNSSWYDVEWECDENGDVFPKQ